MYDDVWAKALDQESMAEIVCSFTGRQCTLKYSKIIPIPNPFTCTTETQCLRMSPQIEQTNKAPARAAPGNQPSPLQEVQVDGTGHDDLGP